MNIQLKRQTTWGCTRYFNIYKNGHYQGKLFNNIAYNLDVSKGDVVEFREGFLCIAQRIQITDETKAITITTTKQINELFSAFLLLFLALSLLIFPVQSLLLFAIAEVIIFGLLSILFRYRSYQFSVADDRLTPSFLKNNASLKSL